MLRPEVCNTNIWFCAHRKCTDTIVPWIKILSRPIPCHSHNLLWLRNWLRVFWHLRLPGVSLLACSISWCPRLFWWLRALGPIGMQRVSVDDRKWKEKNMRIRVSPISACRSAMVRHLLRVRGAPGQSNFNTEFFTASYVMDVVPNVCCSLVPHQKNDTGINSGRGVLWFLKFT